MAKLSIFGLGYVGAVSAACLARDGNSVVGVDPNATKVELINAGRSPIVEGGLEEIIAAAVSSGRLRGTTEAETAINESEISMVCVGTPSAANGSLDLRYVEAVCSEIGTLIGRKQRYHTVVIRSTVLPGTMKTTIIPALQQASGGQAGRDFGICNNPEFLREGTAVADYYHPPKTVIGSFDDRSGSLLESLYKHLPGPQIRTDLATAEMVKYVDNTWHALKVVFANEIGSICKPLRIDSHQVMDIFCQDTKLNISSYYLKPGFAFGGSCLPKDVSALRYEAARLDLDLPMLNSIIQSNRLHIERALNAAVAYEHKDIGILGFSFKAGTDDLRQSPIVELAERLIGKGFNVRLYDKNVSLAQLTGANREYILKHIPHLAGLMVPSINDIVRHAKLIIVGNASEEFGDILDRLSPDQHVLDLVRIAKIKPKSPKYDGLIW